MAQKFEFCNAFLHFFTIFYSYNVIDQGIYQTFGFRSASSARLFFVFFTIFSPKKCDESGSRKSWFQKSLEALGLKKESFFTLFLQKLWRIWYPKSYIYILDRKNFSYRLATLVHLCATFAHFKLGISTSCFYFSD